MKMRLGRQARARSKSLVSQTLGSVFLGRNCNYLALGAVLTQPTVPRIP